MGLSKIGLNIQEARIKKSWRQEDLAEKVDKSAAYIGMIERGERIPKLETFINISNALDVSADEILSDVTKQGYKVRLSQYAERISSLDLEDQEKLNEIADVFLRRKK